MTSSCKEKDLNILLNKLELEFNKKNGVVNTLDIDEGKDHEKVVGGVKSLMTKGYVKLEECKRICTYLTEEGENYAKNGSPEHHLLHVVVKNDGIDVNEAISRVSNGDIGLRKALKMKTLVLSGRSLSLGPAYSGNSVDVTCEVLNCIREYGNNEDELMVKLSKIIESDKELKNELADLKRRKLLNSRTIVCYFVKRTDQFKNTVELQFTDLTSELLDNNNWKSYSVKKYNFFSSGKRVSNGTMHPLVQTMNEFREIFTSMGFEEMDNCDYVESSFWCFDAMYIPQQHPARDIQDTFFTKSPSTANIHLMDKEHIENVSIAHSDGTKYNSTGWRYKWNLNESLRLVARTHVTPCTARLLKSIAKQYQEGKEITPKSYFTMDKVFRNEASDSTHLSEFHQVEGMMIGPGYGLDYLMGVLETFYKSIGITKLRYKPAYNPYTEPSMEIFGFHPFLNKWIEVGNSGVFRPEMLLPMGLPPDIFVLGWGLSVERPTMIKYNINNIRDLVGCKYT